VTLGWSSKTDRGMPKAAACSAVLCKINIPYQVPSSPVSTTTLTFHIKYVGREPPKLDATGSLYTM
jgi:archaellum component FlaG (FlaF/FlaG flagellin family)